jgi:nucleoside-diphosphate-sugar epimerase
MAAATTSLAAQVVLVTGASGFFGAHLCARLAAQRTVVHGVSRSEQPPGPPGLLWRKLDVADRGAVARAVREIRPDLIFHLAGFVSGSRSLDAVFPTFDSHLAGAVNLLQAAAEVGCRRIVLAGSMEEPDPAEETPRSPYAAAKAAAGAYARMHHALYGTPVTVARIFMTYGPAQRDVTKLVPYVALALLREQSPKLGSGVRQVDWIYIDDAVDGLLAAAVAPSVEGRSFDLGSGVLVSIREVVDRIATLVGSKAPLLWGALPERPREAVRAADTAAAERALGWRARVSLDEGLRRTVDWYRRQPPA